MRAALDHVVLEVRDPVRSAAFYERVTITHRDGHNFGARGWASSIYFRDPDGITLEARRYPAGK